MENDTRPVTEQEITDALRLHHVHSTPTCRRDMRDVLSQFIKNRNKKEHENAQH